MKYFYEISRKHKQIIAEYPSILKIQNTSVISLTVYHIFVFNIPNETLKQREQKKKQQNALFWLLFLQ